MNLTANICTNLHVYSTVVHKCHGTNVSTAQIKAATQVKSLRQKKVHTTRKYAFATQKKPRHKKVTAKKCNALRGSEKQNDRVATFYKQTLIFTGNVYCFYILYHCL